MSTPLPTLFLGHGNPMNALSANPYTEAWRRIGQQIPRPRSILCISAHWYVPHAGVTIATAPHTLHDFGGFPRELYEVQYPAPGSPALARRVKHLLAPLRVTLDTSWGLDHGTWSVLRHIYPEADIPVVQLSIDRTQPPAFHYEIGQRLAALRQEGTLILGSGNLVHNLRAYAWDGQPVPAYDWATSFEATAKNLILAGTPAPLIAYESLGKPAALSIPTPDHYLPLLYTLGASQTSDAIHFPVEGIEGGAISMLAIQFG